MNVLLNTACIAYTPCIRMPDMHATYTWGRGRMENYINKHGDENGPGNGVLHHEPEHTKQNVDQLTLMPSTFIQENMRQDMMTSC